MSYQVKNGTSYHAETPASVVAWLETSRERRQTIRVFYGDAKTGKAWPEENDVYGRVGRSTGAIKVPLLVHPRADGAPAMLDHCIVAIVTNDSKGKAYRVYRHPTFDNGTWAVGQDAEGGWIVKHNGKTHAAGFSSEAKAERYRAFMTGERLTR